MTTAPTTHCANCGGEVPVDEPHRVGQCAAPTLGPAAFLLDRIAEDEAAARAVRPNEYLSTRDDLTLTSADVSGYETCAITSGRVLAQCAALRAVVADMSMHLDEPGGWGSLCEQQLRALAQIWRDHEAFQEAWL